jgi:hypothetical protein
MSAIETSIATKPGGATDAKALGQPQRPYRKGFDTLSREVAIDRLPLAW